VNVVRNFMQLLKAKWDERKFVCVGLDSDAGKLPILHLGLPESDERLLEAQRAYIEFQKALKERRKPTPLKAWQQRLLAKAQLKFNKRIIDATKDIVCAYKPNTAFYEALGDAGWKTLVRTIEYINKVAPGVPVILDCKRGDIGNTNFGYVMAAALADAVTVHNYLGVEAMKPFLDQENKGVIILCRTSNPGAGEFQDLEVVAYKRADGTVDTLLLYQRVATNIVDSWNYNGNCGVVAGATYPEQIAEVRKIIGHDMPVLIPGIGKQRGDLDAAVNAGVNYRQQGIIVNNSSAVLFASSEADFAEVAHEAAQQMHDDINAVLAAA
jgi:orotidine-5'-phosphate decarboxylase